MSLTRQLSRKLSRGWVLLIQRLAVALAHVLTAWTGAWVHEVAGTARSCAQDEHWLVCIGTLPTQNNLVTLGIDSAQRTLSHAHPRSMSRLRASIRRRLRRADSPPVPRSRDLSGRTSPSSSTHLPAIPEGVPAATVGGAASSAAGSLGAETEMAALGSPLPAAPAAAVAPAASSAGTVGASPAAGAGAAAEAAAEAAAPASQASLVEVDLSEPRPAPASSPSRRGGLACACFAGGRPMQ